MMLKALVKKPGKKPTAEQKMQEQAKKTAQQLIPIKGIQNGLILTNDNRLVRVLRVSTLNLELMGTERLNQTFRKYANFLQGVRYPLQETIVSQPIDLSHYVQSQNELLEKAQDEKSRWLLKSYIDYTKQFERSSSVIKRQRYLILSVPLKDDSEREFDNVLETIRSRTAEIERKFKQMDLTIYQVSTAEIYKYLHTLYDYKTTLKAGSAPIETPKIITGGHE